MKINKNLYPVLILLAIVVALYSLEVKENFEGTTLNTFLNLPPWFIYTLIILFVLFIFMQMILQFLPWIYGIKTAGDLGGKAINGYFGKKNNTKIIPVTPVYGK